MDKNVFQPLVVLEKKPIAKKFEEVRVAFVKPIEESIDEPGEPNEEPSEPTENNVNPVESSQMIEILDRRKTSRLDRKLIMNRLKNKRATKNTLEASPMMEPTIIEPPMPIKTGEKLVIKPKLRVKPAEPSIPITETTEIVPLIEPVEEQRKIEENVIEEETIQIIKEANNKKPKRGKKTKKQEPIEEMPEVDITTATIRNQKVLDRLPKEKEKIIIKASSYYMNNRKLFVQKLTELFEPYKKELIETQETASCESRSQNENFDLLTHQKIVRDYLNLYSPYRGLLLYHGLGSGKCHKKDTPIMLADGSIKLVQDIQVGDFLMGDDSKPRTVLSLARGRDKMYDIIPVKGEKYTVNQEHILCLRASGFPKLSKNNHKSNTNYNIQWLENNEFQSKTFTFNQENEMEMKMAAEKFYENIKLNKDTNDNVYEIPVKDYLKLSNKKKAFLKGYRVGIDFEDKDIPIDPYMIGYWLGDGTSRGSEITSQDSTVLYYLANNLPKYNLSLLYRSNYTYGITGNGKHNNNIFLNTLKDLNMINNKHIPIIYKCNSRENRLKLLAGLIDSDGCLDNGGFEFTQKNETLMDDVIYLARSLGFSCYKSLKKTTWTSNGEKKYGTTWRTHISGEGIEEIPTKIPRKKAQSRKQKKDVLVTGIKVEYVNEDDYYGFMLDGNCRYVMGDFTVTHNTCTSIAIAEGMKSNKRVFVLTPAALKMNFFSEMKKCGDSLYKKNQFWEFVSIDGKPEYLGILSRALSLPIDFIRKQNGAWLVNVQKPSNYTELDPSQQLDIDTQLNEMIRSKYTDINYNGLRPNKMKILTSNFTKNPFDNSVVLIDEAHNFVSRIVNKIKKPNSIPYMLYDYLMNASNARIVLLSGTPIINYPNEIGILYNILRGYLKTWTIPAVWEKADKINTDTILKILDDGNLKTFDYVEYADNKITITRNPFGFINTKKKGTLKGTKKIPKIKAGGKNSTKKSKESSHEGGSGDVFKRYDGVTLDDAGNLTDDAFINKLQTILKKSDITIRGSIELNKYKALPDDAEEFLNMFVNTDTGDIKESNLLQRRILGLTSYFRSAQEQLLPRFVKTPEGDTYYIIKCEMTQHQYGIYEKIRKEEADREKKSKKNRIKNLQKKNTEELFNISSTYRIFSRACCNFAFPSGIDRPLPNPKKTNAEGEQTEEINELDFDAVPKELRQEVDVYSVTEEQEDIDSVPNTGVDQDVLNYEKRIEKAMADLSKKIENTNESEYLSKDALGTYSPKFAKVLENITNPENDGLHLLYSHFRTIEGIGILRLILLENGFAEFKIKKIGENWDIVDTIEDEGKPRFVLYTGTESPEEKEIIRNIYNSMWDFVPGNIVTKLKQQAENNNYGEIIKVFMITSSGAEGINLRNTRFVHIIEPYWHMVRVDQVVGRARRICSHQDLPEDKRTVKVYLYVTTFSEAQKTDEKNVELRIRDVSRIDKKTPITTDENLYEIASLKQRINNQILRAVKESAIDCNIYSVLSKKDDPDSEKLVCYGFGKVESNQFSSYPTLEKDQSEKSGLDVKRINWEATEVTIAKMKYAMNEATKELYDFESYQLATQGLGEPRLVGRLVTEGNKMKFVPV
uniref:DOD-type homing endonuclease domain-containing protein n=1 Tax=viral metagenome TaxID=1070528 RepID=A0A6C0DCC2_9ZZZZ